MKTLAELKQMPFIPHHDCGVCGETVGWEVVPNTPNPHFNPSCSCGCSGGHYDTWEKVFYWYNTVFEKESVKAVEAAWKMECVVMVDARDYGFAAPTEPRSGDIKPVTNVTLFEEAVSPCIEIDKETIDAIAKEYFKSKENLPKFCDDFSGADIDSVRRELEHWNKINTTSRYADAILFKSVLKATEALKLGNKGASINELYHCGAVILRMIDYVKNEIKE